ncbi:MAG TPA: branched-chain amino acid ABC transporter permease [Actinophytocola sp.]|nr:branched-chain amino acid ABC transporter permease [Actinophytocola sp.]
MTTPLQLLVNGIALGSLLAVVAFGLALVFGVMGVVNFLHAELLTIGGYVTYFLVTGTGAPALLGVALAVAVGLVVGYGVQRAVVGRVADRPPLDGLLLTYGLSVFGLGLITYFLTGDYRSYPAQFDGGLRLGGVYVAARDLVVLAVCVVLLLATGALLRWTRMGAAMRAVAQHREAAAACGINLARIDAVAYALGGGLGAAAGAILSTSFVTTPELGHQWLLIGFVVVVLGGLGSLVGVVAGGLVIGVLQVVLGYLFDDSWAQLQIYLLLFALLLIRPGGLARKAEAT